MCYPAAIAALAFLTVAWGQTKEQASPGDSDRKERFAFLQTTAAEFSLLRPADGAPFPLTPEPVLRYSNLEREGGSGDGATFLWLDGARPVAAASYSLRRPNDVAYREFTSLVNAPLECRRMGAVVWAPQTGGMAPITLDDAPTPAAGKPLRLTQMRSLSRRFSATCYSSQTDAPTELRLLSQPLYRYVDEKAGVLDGAVFAFVVSNDPELFLVLEAVRDGKQATGRWTFSLARMSSLKEIVKLDGKEVWSVANFWRSGDDRTTGPYTEARTGQFDSAGVTPFTK